uniref:ATP synthase F0 subunit 8 n=1 Tax=Dilar sp. YW-2016 TaxID=1821762 RepID=A0A1S5QY59_9NEOP|nr:ATP synthase F0 subunit 8 [Dilar sp. YW-2016]
MPQMSPLNWWTLMIYFILLFMMFHSMNYFMYLYSPSFNMKNKIMTNPANWLW